jgi:uncharacterized membrane protein YbhN (UPF0104 family)
MATGDSSGAGADPVTDPAALTSDAPATPGILQTREATPLQKLTRALLSLLLLYLIFGVLIPSFADYEDVWAAITSLSMAAVVAMVLITLLIETLKSAAPASLVPGFSVFKAFLSQEAAAVVSNTIPGPSGTVAKYSFYTRFGVDPVTFGKAIVVNGAFNNAVALILPSIAIAALATQDDVPSRVIWLAVVGLVISMVGIAVVVGIMRSERFARGFGERLGRVLNWARGLVNRPPAEAVGEAVAGFRMDVLATVTRRGPLLLVIILCKDLATYLGLVVSLRAVGAPHDDLTAVEIFAVYSLVRLLTLIEITPGNIGIAETLYISGLIWAAESTSDDTIVAGVFVFRMFTYLLPIVLGGVCWIGMRRYFTTHPHPVLSAPAEG